MGESHSQCFPPKSKTHPTSSFLGTRRNRRRNSQSIQRDLNHSAESEATLEKEGKAQDKIKKRHHHLGLATDATQTHLHKQNEEIPVLHAKLPMIQRIGFASQNADTNEKFGLETSPEEEDTTDF